MEFLGYFFPESYFNGEEVVKSFQKFAQYEYNIWFKKYREEFTYDLICLYHTLEHLQEPDNRLADYLS